MQILTLTAIFFLSNPFLAKPEDQADDDFYQWIDNYKELSKHLYIHRTKKDLSRSIIIHSNIPLIQKYLIESTPDNNLTLLWEIFNAAQPQMQELESFSIFNLLLRSRVRNVLKEPRREKEIPKKLAKHLKIESDDYLVAKYMAARTQAFELVEEQDVIGFFHKTKGFMKKKMESHDDFPSVCGSKRARTSLFDLNRVANFIPSVTERGIEIIKAKQFSASSKRNEELYSFTPFKTFSNLDKVTKKGEMMKAIKFNDSNAFAFNKEVNDPFESLFSKELESLPIIETKKQKIMLKGFSPFPHKNPKKIEVPVVTPDIGPIPKAPDFAMFHKMDSTPIEADEKNLEAVAAFLEKNLHFRTPAEQRNEQLMEEQNRSKLDFLFDRDGKIQRAHFVEVCKTYIKHDSNLATKTFFENFKKNEKLSEPEKVMISTNYAILSERYQIFERMFLVSSLVEKNLFNVTPEVIKHLLMLKSGQESIWDKLFLESNTIDPQRQSREDNRLLELLPNSRSKDFFKFPFVGNGIPNLIHAQLPKEEYSVDYEKLIGPNILVGISYDEIFKFESEEEIRKILQNLMNAAFEN